MGERPVTRALPDDATTEPWQWHVTSPSEIGRVASLLRQSNTIIECTTAGTSMGATLPPGSRIRFRCGPTDAAVGDVVVLLAGPSDLIAHRVVATGMRLATRRYLLTRGDNSVLCDQPVQRSAVLGVVLERADGDAWFPVSGPPRGSPSRRWFATCYRFIMRVTLEVDYRLAVRFAAWSYFALERIRSRRP